MRQSRTIHPFLEILMMIFAEKKLNMAILEQSSPSVTNLFKIFLLLSYQLIYFDKSFIKKSFSSKFNEYTSCMMHDLKGNSTNLINDSAEADTFYWFLLMRLKFFVIIDCMIANDA